MRQAILITAYRDIDQLCRLVDFFDEDFSIYIHLDKKCKDDSSRLVNRDNVFLYRKFAVEWGDYRHLKAIVLLMEEALKGTADYFHLITGSDYPTMPLIRFKAFCQEHCDDNYLEHFPLPHSEWGPEGGLNRIQYWWLRPNSTRSKGAWVTRKFVNLQRRMGIKRGFNYFDGKIYGGGTYWSVSRKAVQVAVNYMVAHPDYLRRFRMTSIAEEICLPTLWVNSGLRFVNNYMRYIDWGSDGANPQVLTEKNYDSIIASRALFARKMQSGISDILIKRLNANE